jgi:hypothetical protein
MPESPWEKLQAGLVLGSEAFLEVIRQQVTGNKREQPALGALEHRPRLAQVIKVVESLKQEKWDDFRDRYGDWGRDLVLYLGRVRCGLKLRELASAVGGIDYTAVGIAVKRFQQKLDDQPDLARALAKAKIRLAEQFHSHP